VKILAAVLIVTAIWILLASLREGRHRRRAAVDTHDVWMIEQHDPVPPRLIANFRRAARAAVPWT
jgi:hypothetical protein